MATNQPATQMANADICSKKEREKKNPAKSKL